MDERDKTASADNIHDRDYIEKFLATPLAADGLVSIGGRPVESLDGTWKFAVEQYDTCLRAEWFREVYEDGSGRSLPVDFDWNAWEDMAVPATWNTVDPRYFYYEGAAVYTRSFRYSGLAGERAILRFEGANYRTILFLNGEYVGFHDGGSGPFCVEVTGKLAAKNRIVAFV